MFVIDENTNAIQLTRGDTAKITVSFTEGGDPYDFSDDVVKFELTPDDTKDMEFGDYLYDIEIQHTVEGETEEDEDTVEVYTPIAAAKFSLMFNVL